MTAKFATQRSREFRQRLALKGAASLTITVNRDTARRLRTIVREHGRSMADVIKVGAILSQRALAGTTATAAE